MAQPAAVGAAAPCWVVEMEKTMGDAAPSVEKERWKKHSIYRVPERMKNGTRSNIYRPEVVSLGPFHHGDPALQPMEEHKQRALRHLVRRSKRPLQLFVAAVEEVAQQLEDAYEGLGVKWRGAEKREEFVKLMVTDGCFLLEVMRANESEGKPGEDDYAPNDPVFSEHGYLYLFSAIMYDTLVLENQLPLLLLQKLLSVQDGTYQVTEAAEAVNKKVLLFLQGLEDDLVGMDTLGLHPLGIFHTSFARPPVEPKKNEAESAKPTERSCSPYSTEGRGHRTWKKQSNVRNPTDNDASKGIKGGDDRELTMHPAVELYEAGVRLTKSEGRSLQGITFHGGALHVPEITVDDYTERKLLNLMAFERLHVDAGNDVTDYVFFLDGIVDTAKDVELLRSKKIIENLLGSDEEVAKLFNALASGGALDGSGRLRDVRREVNRYCGKSLPRWQAYFAQVPGEPLGVHLPRRRCHPARRHPRADCLHCLDLLLEEVTKLASEWNVVVGNNPDDLATLIRLFATKNIVI